MDSEKGFERPDMQIWGIQKTNCAVWWPTTVCIQGTAVTLQSTPKEPPQKPLCLEHSVAVNISLIHVYIINNGNVQTISETLSSLHSMSVSEMDNFQSEIYRTNAIGRGEDKMRWF